MGEAGTSLWRKCALKSSLKKSDSERKGKEQGRPGHRSYSFPKASEKEQLGVGWRERGGAGRLLLMSLEVTNRVFTAVSC